MKELHTILQQLQKFIAKRAGKETQREVAGRDDPFEIDKPGLSFFDPIKGVGGAEGPTFEVMDRLMEEGIDPKDIDFHRIFKDVKKGVLKDGRPVGKVKDAIFEAEKRRIGAESTDPSPPPVKPEAPNPSPKKPDPPEDGETPDPSSDASSRKGGEEGARLPGPGAKLEDTAHEADIPEARAFMRDVVKPGSPLDEILLKRPQDLTEGEVREVMIARIDTPRNDERERLAEVEKAFFEDKFSTDPAEFDAASRMIEPKPRKPINRDPIPVAAADGEPLDKGLRRIGRKVVAQSKGDGLAATVRRLQGGLNILGDAGAPDGGGAGWPSLKKDGVFGPKTRSGLRRAIATLGTPKVEEALALGRMGEFAHDGRRDGFGRLGEVTESAIGPLFRGPARPARRPGERLETITLQETLNDLGAGHFGPDGFETLKVDGNVGPKTAEVFGRLTAALGPEHVTRRLGEFLGFFSR